MAGEVYRKFVLTTRCKTLWHLTRKDLLMHTGLVFEIANCDLKASASVFVSRNKENAKPLIASCCRPWFSYLQPRTFDSLPTGTAGVPPAMSG